MSLRRTLLDLSDHHRQVAYKRAVPFVHVPSELLEQWSGHLRLLRGTQWFRRLFTPQQLATLDEFATSIERLVGALPAPLPDVPEILELAAWKDLCAEATALLRAMPAESP